MSIFAAFVVTPTIPLNELSPLRHPITGYDAFRIRIRSAKPNRKRKGYGYAEQQ